MRLGTLRLPGGTTTAVRVDGGSLVALAAPDVATVLSRGIDDCPVDHAATGRLPRPGDADLAPVVRPRKAIFVGLNYRDHILEMGRELPTHPTLFTKFDDALVGPNDPVELRGTSRAWDYEVELGVVVGRPVARDTDRDDAVAAIAGYTVVNDVTARDWQKRTLQFLQGKSWDATTPVGPWLVTADELDPKATGRPDLAVSCTVNGDQRQAGRTSDLVFDPARLISYISHITILAPGDLVATGTPGGVAAGMDPPGWLTPGDVVEASVEGVGACITRCR